MQRDSGICDICICVEVSLLMVWCWMGCHNDGGRCSVGIVENALSLGQWRILSRGMVLMFGRILFIQVVMHATTSMACGQFCS